MKKSSNFDPKAFLNVKVLTTKEDAQVKGGNDDKQKVVIKQKGGIAFES